MQDFSWALATGHLVLNAAQSAAVEREGRERSAASTAHLRSHLAQGEKVMRFMGRRRRDESPLMMLKNGWLARSPETSRIVVPLLPE